MNRTTLIAGLAVLILAVIAGLIGLNSRVGLRRLTGRSASAHRQDRTDQPTTASGDRERSRSMKLAYIVSDLSIPFWDIMNRGVQQSADGHGYQLRVFNAGNDKGKELAAVAMALKEQVDGIIVSPTSSSACATILKLAERAGVPVVICDIGTDRGEYVSYISSDNRTGAYDIGKILCNRFRSLGWSDATVGIVAIPQSRQNGRMRTEGFLKALSEAGFKSSGLKQQETFSEQETYEHCKALITGDPQLRAIWLQGSDKYRGALRAIADAGKTGKILLVTFDAEPEFIEMIRNGELLGAAMQQPYLMGRQGVDVLVRHLRGEAVASHQQVPVIAVSTENLDQQLPLIRKHVLGLTVTE